MKIKSVKVWLEQLPLTKHYTIAYKTIVDTEIIFLEVTLENGITGIGAANPFAEVVGETPAVTLANLQQGLVVLTHQVFLLINKVLCSNLWVEISVILINLLMSH